MNLVSPEMRPASIDRPSNVSVFFHYHVAIGVRRCATDDAHVDWEGAVKQVVATID